MNWRVEPFWLSPLAPTDPAWRRVDLWLSAGVVACVAAVWIYFTG